MKIFFPFILEIFENEISLYMWNFIQQQIISKRNDCFLSAHISFLFMTLFRCIRRRDLNTERNFFCSINHVFMIFCFFCGFLIRLFSCAKQKLLILRIFDSLMEFMGRFKWIFHAKRSKSGWENCFSSSIWVLEENFIFVSFLSSSFWWRNLPLT